MLNPGLEQSSAGDAMTDSDTVLPSRQFLPVGHEDCNQRLDRYSARLASCGFLWLQVKREGDRQTTNLLKTLDLSSSEKLRAFSIFLSVSVSVFLSVCLSVSLSLFPPLPPFFPLCSAPFLSVYPPPPSLPLPSLMSCLFSSDSFHFCLVLFISFLLSLFLFQSSCCPCGVREGGVEDGFVDFSSPVHAFRRRLTSLGAECVEIQN